MEDSTVHVLHQSKKESRGYFNGPLSRIEINWKSQLHKSIFPAVCFGSPSLSHSLFFFLSSSVVGFEILLVMMLFWKRTTSEKSLVHEQQHTVPKQPHLLILSPQHRQIHKPFRYLEPEENCMASFGNTDSSQSSVSYHREGRDCLFESIGYY